jgi:acyl carrier protein
VRRVELPIQEPTSAAETVLTVIKELLERRGAAEVEITPDSKLSAQLGLDSLELAELSAALEDDLGRDPYTAGLVPETVGELVAFYQ